MANDRQRCYAIPVIITLKKNRFSGNFSEVAMRKEKLPDTCVCFESDRIYRPLSLQVLVQSISGYFQENRVRFCAFWNQGLG